MNGHAKTDIIGKRFGRLVVVKDSGLRSGDGSCMWECLCDCGTTHLSNGCNLKAGSVKSCGCLRKELFIARSKARAKPPVKCSVDGCHNTTEKGAHGFCGMHYMRQKRYGNLDYVTPDIERRKRCREAQPTLGKCKLTTYKKNLGKHEHRRVIEDAIGRKLKSNEIVHHIDCNPHNNSVDNLKLTNHSEHARIHFSKRKEK